MSVHIHCLPSSLLSSTNNFKNYSHPFEKAFPAENYQTLPHLPWSFGFYLSSHWTVPPLLIQFLLTPSFSLFPIGFPTAWFDWKSCVIRSCLFCWLYITICVLYCQLFCLKFLFFLFIFYLSLNCVCFIFKYIFLTESLKCKKHGKNPDNTRSLPCADFLTGTVLRITSFRHKPGTRCSLRNFRYAWSS